MGRRRLTLNEQSEAGASGSKGFRFAECNLKCRVGLRPRVPLKTILCLMIGSLHLLGNLWGTLLAAQRIIMKTSPVRDREHGTTVSDTWSYLGDGSAHHEPGLFPQGEEIVT